MTNKTHEQMTELEKLETLLFLLNMKDNWTAEDWKFYDQWMAEAQELRKQAIIKHAKEETK